MLGCIQPISSPMMNRMLGLLGACAWAVADARPRTAKAITRRFLGDACANIEQLLSLPVRLLDRHEVDEGCSAVPMHFRQTDRNGPAASNFRYENRRAARPQLC